MSKKVISYKYFPTRCPLLLGLVAWLMLDRTQAVGWVHGVVWCFIGICTIGWLHAILTESWVHPKEV